MPNFPHYINDKNRGTVKEGSRECRESVKRVVGRVKVEDGSRKDQDQHATSAAIRSTTAFADPSKDPMFRVSSR
jgi:hypothetical protein